MMIGLFGAASSVAGLISARAPERPLIHKSAVVAVVLGLTAQILSLFAIEGLPHRKFVLTSGLLVDLLAGALVLAGTSAVVARVSRDVQLPERVLRVLSLTGVVGEAFAATRIIDARFKLLVSPSLVLVLSAVGLAVVAALPLIRRSSVGSRPIQRGTLAMAGWSLAGILALVAISLPAAVRAHQHGSAAVVSPGSNLGLANSGRVGASSDANFTSGILPSDSNGSNLPIVMNFSGTAVVGNPNIHQVVVLRYHGRVGNGRTGIFELNALGVPQPDGTLSLRSSRALLLLHLHHQLGTGFLTALSSRYAEGTIHFKSGDVYRFALSTSATPSNQLIGRLTLIPTDSSSSTSGAQTGAA
jgi:hypothetical protein